MGWTWYRCGARKRDGSPDVKAECDGLLRPAQGRLVFGLLAGGGRQLCRLVARSLHAGGR